MFVCVWVHVPSLDATLRGLLPSVRDRHARSRGAINKSHDSCQNGFARIAQISVSPVGAGPGGCVRQQVGFRSVAGVPGRALAIREGIKRCK